MNLFAMMETSGGAMQAERMRAEVVAANMANAETTGTATGGVYRRQHVVFAANVGDPNFADSLSNTVSETEASNAANATLPLNLIRSGAVAPGVHIAAVVEDNTPPRRRFDPGNPDAGADGYVSYPDINPLTEMVDLMGATRAYGLNSSAVQAEKSMITSALEITKS